MSETTDRSGLFHQFRLLSLSNFIYYDEWNVTLMVILLVLIWRSSSVYCVPEILFLCRWLEYVLALIGNSYPGSASGMRLRRRQKIARRGHQIKSVWWNWSDFSFYRAAAAPDPSDPGHPRVLPRDPERATGTSRITDRTSHNCHKKSIMQKLKLSHDFIF